MNAHGNHEAYLRAALHAAADSLEPGADGLERIRARVRRPRWRAVVWLAAAWNELRLRAPAGLQDAAYQLAAELRGAKDRFAPVLTPGKHRLRTQSWLRPLTAMVMVMFIVAAGTYVAINVSTAVSPSSAASNGQAGKPGPVKHPAASPSASSSPSGSESSPKPSASPCPSSPKPSSPTTSPTPEATSSPSTQSPSPSASPSPSTSSASPAATPGVQLTAVVISAGQTSSSPCGKRSSGATPGPSADTSAAGLSQLILTAADARPAGETVS